MLGPLGWIKKNNSNLFVTLFHFTYNRSQCARMSLPGFVYMVPLQRRGSRERDQLRETENWETGSSQHTAVFFIPDAEVKSHLFTCMKHTHA